MCEHVPVSGTSCLVSCCFLEKQFLRKHSDQLCLRAVKVPSVENKLAAFKWQLSHVSNFTDIFLHTLLNTQEQKLENVMF